MTYNDLLANFPVEKIKKWCTWLNIWAIVGDYANRDRCVIGVNSNIR